jgi:MerR family transcriptional regulator, light-induced transcriptional regulator
MAEFASRLKVLRKEKGIRQVDLAKEMGVAQTTIANYEQHSRFPDENALRNIANYFEVSLDYLLGQSDSRHLENTRTGSWIDINTNGKTLSQKANEYLSLLLDGRREKARDGILKAVSGGMAVRAVYRDIFEPALRELGGLWEAGEIDVAKEHYFSEATEALINELYPVLKPAKQQRGVAVCLSVSGELHHIGIKMISHILEEEGWRCFYLGVNTPTAALIKTIEEIDADLLAVSATMPFNVDSVANTIFRVRSSFPKRPLKIVAGGRAFNMDAGLWKRIGADGSAAGLDEAVRFFSGL